MQYVQRIRDLREDNDLTQTEVAKILNTNQKVYSRYETAENEMPIRHLITLCKFYNVSADYILGFTNTPHSIPKDWVSKVDIFSKYVIIKLNKELFRRRLVSDVKLIVEKQPP